MKAGKRHFILFFFLLFSLVTKAQEAYTPEKTLWTCPTDATLKITYRMNNYSNEIEIIGPFNMSDNNSISGVLKISEGTFVEPKQLSAKDILNNNYKEDKSGYKPTLDINISEKYYYKTFMYYGTDSKPFVTFEGKLRNANSEKKLDELFEKSRKINKSTTEKVNNLTKDTLYIKKQELQRKIKHKPAVIGVRG